jgi:hypothetical protein
MKPVVEDQKSIERSKSRSKSRSLSHNKLKKTEISKISHHVEDLTVDISNLKDLETAEQNSSKKKRERSRSKRSKSRNRDSKAVDSLNSSRKRGFASKAKNFNKKTPAKLRIQFAKKKKNTGVKKKSNGKTHSKSFRKSRILSNQNSELRSPKTIKEDMNNDISVQFENSSMLLDSRRTARMLERTDSLTKATPKT